MPGRSGFEVLEELKSNPATRQIPVVIHSSRELCAADYSALSNRILAVLPKVSVNRKEALLAIRRAIDDPGLFSGEPEFLLAER